MTQRIKLRRILCSAALICSLFPLMAYAVNVSFQNHTDSQVVINVIPPNDPKTYFVGAVDAGGWFANPFPQGSRFLVKISATGELLQNFIAYEDMNVDIGTAPVSISFRNYTDSLVNVSVIRPNDPQEYLHGSIDAGGRLDNYYFPSGTRFFVTSGATGERLEDFIATYNMNIDIGGAPAPIDDPAYRKPPVCYDVCVLEIIVCVQWEQRCE